MMMTGMMTRSRQ